MQVEIMAPPWVGWVCVDDLMEEVFHELVDEAAERHQSGKRVHWPPSLQAITERLKMKLWKRYGAWASHEDLRRAAEEIQARTKEEVWL